MGYFTADPKDLFHVRKIYIVVYVLAGPDASGFDPTVTLIKVLVLRGEKRPDSGLLWPPGAKAGYL